MAQINSAGEGKILRIESNSPQFTHFLGKILGTNADRGDIFCLEGELGTGKTCLIGGIAEGLGIKEGVFSPSFIIIALHKGRLPLFHIDLYRIDEGEIEELGLEEYLYGEGVCAIEWAEKARAILPPSHLWINISYDNGQRLLTFFSKGRKYEPILEELRKVACVRN